VIRHGLHIGQHIRRDAVAFVVGHAVDCTLAAMSREVQPLIYGFFDLV
jgi:hypothetical protein